MEKRLDLSGPEWLRGNHDSSQSTAVLSPAIFIMTTVLSVTKGLPGACDFASQFSSIVKIFTVIDVQVASTIVIATTCTIIIVIS